VIRPRTAEHPDYRGYAGQVAAGVVRPGDEVLVLPAGHRSTVQRIDTPGGELPAATTGQSVTLLLADDLDIGRGDLIVAAEVPPVVTDTFTATVCWLSDRPLRRASRLLVKHGTRTVAAIVTDLLARFDEQLLSTVDAPEALQLNEIGRIMVRAAEPLPVDQYTDSRRTGCFLVIDPAGGATLAAGLIGGHLPVLQTRPESEVQGCIGDDGRSAGAVVHHRALTSPGP
jgi:sulfate adenylyltransferase subunit 1